MGGALSLAEQIIGRMGLAPGLNLKGKAVLLLHHPDPLGLGQVKYQGDPLLFLHIEGVARSRAFLHSGGGLHPGKADQQPAGEPA